MAVASELLKICRKFSPIHNTFLRCYATKVVKQKDFNRKLCPKIDATADSLAAKGFLRAQKEYDPPADLDNKLNYLFKTIVGTTANDYKLKNLNESFQLLNACEQEFNHAVPNSQLHQIQTLGDIIQFYKTKIDLRTPLDKMKSMELPENLHVQFDYHRFHPETDTKFGGITAFPKSSTYVSGLKYKDKYKGHIQTEKYPDV